VGREGWEVTTVTHHSLNTVLWARRPWFRMEGSSQSAQRALCDNGCGARCCRQVVFVGVFFLTKSKAPGGLEATQVVYRDLDEQLADDRAVAAASGSSPVCLSVCLPVSPCISSKAGPARSDLLGGRVLASQSCTSTRGHFLTLRSQLVVTRCSSTTLPDAGVLVLCCLSVCLSVRLSVPHP
jgi:hypothetical protein